MISLLLWFISIAWLNRFGRKTLLWFFFSYCFICFILFYFVLRFDFARSRVLYKWWPLSKYSSLRSSADDQWLSTSLVVFFFLKKLGDLMVLGHQQAIVLVILQTFNKPCARAWRNIWALLDRTFAKYWDCLWNGAVWICDAVCVTSGNNWRTDIRICFLLLRRSRHR